MTPKDVPVRLKDEIRHAAKEGLIELTVLGPDSYVAHLTRAISPDEWDALMQEDEE